MTEPKPDRTDEELLAFTPVPGRHWSDGGFHSLEEFQRWSRLKNEAWLDTRTPGEQVTRHSTMTGEKGQ